MVLTINMEIRLIGPKYYILISILVFDLLVSLEIFDGIQATYSYTVSKQVLFNFFGLFWVDAHTNA